MIDYIRYSDGVDLSLIRDAPALPQGRKRRGRLPYKDLVCAFDIETTNYAEKHESFMYVWQLCIDDKITIVGRYWWEFRRLFNDINKILTNANNMLVVYVHNLSFEEMFLKSIIPIQNLQALDTRKVLRFESNNLEFRCSYMHANMSLAKYLENMGVEDQKLSYDYNKIRYPDTELTHEEILYCIHDVTGLVQALKKEMLRDGDDLYTIPLTSTGYIRRKAKDALKGYQRYIRPMLPDLEEMLMLREEFRGGNTHGHRMNTGKIISAKPSRGLGIHGVDISSSYPTQLIREKYPGQFIKRDPGHIRIALQYKKSFIALFRLYNVCLKKPLWGCPYIARAKCSKLKLFDQIPEYRQIDNGRVLMAEYIEAVYNEIDFAILESEYTFRYEVVTLYTARRSYLPDKFRALILEEYQAKTALKGLDEYRYGKAKNRFNSLYG